MTTLNRTQARKLAEEATQLADWLTIRDFALQCYGEEAATVEIETYGEYDDEGGTDYSINGITVYDHNGDELPINISLSFFQTKAWKDLDVDEERAKEEFLELFREIDEYSFKETAWVLFENLPCDQNGEYTTYNLTTEPTLSLPE
jgi:hypothetical protein